MKEITLINITMTNGDLWTIQVPYEHEEKSDKEYLDIVCQNIASKPYEIVRTYDTYSPTEAAIMTNKISSIEILQRRKEA